MNKWRSLTSPSLFDSEQLARAFIQYLVTVGTGFPYRHRASCRHCGPLRIPPLVLPFSFAPSLSREWVINSVMAEVAEAAPPVEMDVVGDGDEEAPAFDLGAKKKKKKKKSAAATAQGTDTAIDSVDALAANAESMELADAADAQAAAEAAAALADVPIEFPTSDFGPGKKKKKRKKVVFEDDDDGDDLDVGAEAGENGERVSRRVIAPQPWDDSDRDYTYDELLARALEFLHGKNSSLPSGGFGIGAARGRKKIALQFPQVARDGTKKTVFLNFGAIAKAIHRQQDHLLAYLCAELGTSGNVQDAGRLVIKGRFQAEGIANVLKKYMMDYVVCQSCLSPDTVLMRDANTRLYFVSCESCGAHRSVANISAGYVARVTRRKKAG